MSKKKQENPLVDLNETIAIIGMGCQFPGTSEDIEDTQALNNLLIGGLSPIREVPLERWDTELYFDSDRGKEDKIVTRKGGFLNNIHLFDAAFFKIPAIEAKQMDPQHRLFLEVAIRTINHANLTLESLKNSNTGVYCGISTHEYSQLNYKDNIKFNAYTPIGMAPSAAPGRLAHFLDLKGPCLSVDTACSSSLTALHHAVNALRLNQCDLAFVGGVHLNICPEPFIGLSKAKMLSASGQCNSFDADADGYVRSEGCAVILVQRLKDAVKQKNRVLALIKATAINQDGGGSSVMVPNLEAQVAMHRKILEQAQLSPADIDYIEAHGTGTAVGDAIEFNAIQKVHQGHHLQEKPLIIGALKSVLGHTLSSSGLASLLKVVGAFINERIPPNLHFINPQRSINPDGIPALFPVKAVPYPVTNHKKRRAQVVNFGFTGSNASVIIEEGIAPSVEPLVNEDTSVTCFALSAQTERSLIQMLKNYQTYLRQTAERLEDICFTLINCRDHYRFRCAFLVKNKEELLKKIEHAEDEIVSVDSKAVYTANTAEELYQAYLAGFSIFLTQGERYQKVDLPLYAFDRKEYWHESRAKAHQPIVTMLEQEPIAIIGMSCRYPKAENVDELLALLQDGGNGMSDIPLERWDNEKYYDSDPEAPGKLYIKQLGLLKNIKTFDADFFNISYREAKLMAPQLRIFLECSYHAIENANLALDRIKNSNTGVFVGVGTNEYPLYLLSQGLIIEELNMYFATGNVLNAVPGRVAYSFDFHGPTQAVDTACSSSLTAIHNACLSLQAGDCDLALAGGVNVLIQPNSNITLSKAKMLSPESRCKTFSKDADGYARSEGCGIIVLKRLSSALKDKDKILALIKGSAINSDGKSGGFTVPNGTAQEEVIRHALARAKLSPAEVDCIEAHGTGTPLADPIEVNTLMSIFAAHHSSERPLYLSSIKTNIGHSESAAGVAGVIKAVLSLNKKQLFKHLNFKELNPGIELKNTHIPLATMPWEKTAGLRTIGISSFGFSGANAHAILQEYPISAPKSSADSKESLLLLSAKSKEALALVVQRYIDFLEHTKESFADICYTAATCRAHYLNRVAVIASSTKEAALQLEQKKYGIFALKKEYAKTLADWSLTALQKAYQQGIKIDWIVFFATQGETFSKVDLPLYPFVAKEHWYEKKGSILDSPLPQDWSFKLQWHAQPLQLSSTKLSAQKWLLIGSFFVAQGLRALGLSIYLEEDNYPIEQLDGVFFAEALTEQVYDGLEQQKNNLKKLINKLKELRNHQSLQLIVLTNNAIAEQASDKINQNGAALIGFCKTLALELPQFKAILIDLDNPLDATNAARIGNEIQQNKGQNYEHVVCYRKGIRYVSRLKKTRISTSKRTLRDGGKYLITGGTGGLGLITAQALLSLGAQELALIARTVNKEDIKASIKKLESSYPGRVIKLYSLDVTNKEQLAALLTELNAEGLLKGIVHTAGAAIKAPLLQHQEEDIDYLFAAKVAGARNLHELTKTYNLDFFILFSSIASVFGSNKEAVYSGANSCLDLLVAERLRLGLPASCIQWGPWGEVGMAQKRALNKNLKKALITNEQGFQFIKTLINTNLPQMTIISPDYLRFMLDFVPLPQALFYKQLEQELDFQERPNNHDSSSWVQTYFNLSKSERASFCVELVASLCNHILDGDDPADLDEEEGFFELGFDSLTIAELASELKKKLEPAIPIMINIGFNYPTINKLAQHIENALELYRAAPAAEQKATQTSTEDIAVIGMSCSFPQAPNIQYFERLLEEGTNTIQDIPQSRWDNTVYYDSNVDAPGKSYVNKLGLVDHIKDFDASFFGISPREAQYIEPQQRLFLECCYTAIESANYPLPLLQGSSTGVFAGVGPNEYYLHLKNSSFPDDELSVYTITGNVVNLISGRVAYTFDFKGPSLSVDTACSSSLVALHYACQSLKTKETDYALAGGVNVVLLPESNITLCRAKALSPEGQCKTFDESANGYVRSEGCGVLLLKRLSDAQRDKDTILAVIKASAVNNDGRSAGLTVPNGKSQAQVMLKALSQSHLDLNEIGYVEAHGTGTPLGDPIEVEAINAVYGDARLSDNPLYLGTVKTNIGHLESASGIAGIIKTILSLKNHKIYRHLNFKNLNPSIQLKQARIPLETTHWSSKKALRAAGVNAFGFSGTNAHVIVQEYKNPTGDVFLSTNQIYVLNLSAKSKYSLDGLVHQYQEFLANTDACFADICFTAATCRSHYQYRLIVVAANNEEALACLTKGDVGLSYDENRALPIANVPLDTLAQSYLKGKEVDWSHFYKHLHRSFQKVSLPVYVFDRINYWPDTKNELLAQDPQPKVISIHAVKNDSTLWNQLKNQSTEERFSNIQLVLRQITAEVMRLEQADIEFEADLFKLGLDSLMAVEIRSRIHDALNCPTLSIAMEYFIHDPKIERIARAVVHAVEEIMAQSDSRTDKEIPNEIALCDFQYPFWVLNKYLYPHNLGIQIHLKGALNKNYFERAFTAVVNNHPAFWLEFDEYSPIQRVQKQGTFQVFYLDLGADFDCDDLFVSNLNSLIPLREQPLIRVYLYTINPKLHELHILIPHIIAEGTSCDLILSQLKLYYEKLLKGKSLPIMPEENHFFSYVQNNNRHYETNIREKIKFWKNYNKDTQYLYFGSANHLADASSPQEHYLINYPLDAALVAKFNQWHTLKNVNISSGLIALCHLTFYALTGQYKIPITIMHTGREGAQYQHCVGLFAEYKRINSIINESNSYSDLLDFIEEQLILSAPYQRCSYLIKNKVLKGRLNLGEFLIVGWHRLRYTRLFKKIGLHHETIKVYLNYLGKFYFGRLSILTKWALKRQFNWDLSLQKPHPLHVLISITPSFFSKSPEVGTMGDLHYDYPNHYAYANRSIGNQNLGVFFTKDQKGVVHFSINGPLTKECKDKIAATLVTVLKAILSDEKLNIAHLIQFKDLGENSKELQ